MGRVNLHAYRGTIVADGFAVYEVLARGPPAFTLAHRWSHAKRKYEEIAEQGPMACDVIDPLIGQRYAIERPPRGPPDQVAASAADARFRSNATSSRLIEDRRTRRDQPTARLPDDRVEVSTRAGARPGDLESAVYHRRIIRQRLGANRAQDDLGTF